MVRRVISLGLCLGLVALGPAPLSACAMLANLPADCGPAPAQSSDCEQMDMHHPAQEVRANLNASCCQITRPAPDAATAAKKTTAPELVTVPIDAEPVSLEARANPAPAASPQLASPLERQSLFCVFLI